MKSLKPVEKIVSNNTSILKHKFDREVIAINKKLLNIYWTTKLHKNLTKTRFIIATPNCSVRAPQEAAVAALKLIYDQIKHYNFIIEYYSDVKIFWPVQNNQTVINTISKSNSSYKAVSVSTFDFCALYANIPHHKLKSVMGELINFYLNGRDKELIEITMYGAIWNLFNKNIGCLLIKQL